MKQSACSAVICQPGGHEQKHDISLKMLLQIFTTTFYYTSLYREKKFTNIVACLKILIYLISKNNFFGQKL